jgi:glycosyltransferase involved in cell wall biosynthesis
VSEPRVLFISGEYPPMSGGVGDYTALLRESLDADGIASTVLAPEGARGDHVRTVKQWDWRTLRRVQGAVRRTHATIVHIQYQAGAFGMHPSVNLLPWMLRRSIPVVTTFHDLRPPFLFPKAAHLRQFVMLRMARASTAAIVTNPADAGRLRKTGLTPVEIPIGPNLPAPGAGALVESDTVAFFGFPSRSKGIVELIEANGLIDATRRPRMMQVGAQGTPAATIDLLAGDEIDRLAQYHEVAVCRTGYLTPQAASDALARSGVIALPFQRGASLRSGSLLAALQSGRAVVTTLPSHPSLIQAIARLPQLVLVPRNDAGRLWDGIEEALTVPRRFEPLPVEFTWGSIADRHADLYREILERRAR